MQAEVLPKTLENLYVSNTMGVNGMVMIQPSQVRKRMDGFKTNDTDLITLKIRGISEVGLVRKILCKSLLNAYTDHTDNPD